MTPISNTRANVVQFPAPCFHSPPLDAASRKTHHSGIILKIEVNPIRSSPRLALSHHNRRHDLLPQLGLPFLDSGHDHITNTCSRKTVETGTTTLDRDDVEISCAGIIAAIHDRSTTETNVSFIVQALAKISKDKGRTYTGRPRVILSLLPEAPPRLHGGQQSRVLKFSSSSTHPLFDILTNVVIDQCRELWITARDSKVRDDLCGLP